MDTIDIKYCKNLADFTLDILEKKQQERLAFDLKQDRRNQQEILELVNKSYDATH
jgi:hypothetical protein